MNIIIFHWYLFHLVYLPLYSHVLSFYITFLILIYQFLFASGNSKNHWILMTVQPIHKQFTQTPYIVIYTFNIYILHGLALSSFSQFRVEYLLSFKFPLFLYHNQWRLKLHILDSCSSFTPPFPLLCSLSSACTYWDQSYGATVKSVTLISPLLGL